MPLAIPSSSTVHVFCHQSYKSSSLWVTYFSFPSAGAVAASVCRCSNSSLTTLPCWCTQRSPMRLSDKCTIAHNTCSTGLYIDLLICPRSHCNINSTPHQFQSAMSPMRTLSCTYQIYDNNRLVSGIKKTTRSGGKWGYESTRLGLLMINEEHRSWTFFLGRIIAQF